MEVAPGGCAERVLSQAQQCRGRRLSLLQHHVGHRELVLQCDVDGEGLLGIAHLPHPLGGARQRGQRGRLRGGIAGQFIADGGELFDQVSEVWQITRIGGLKLGDQMRQRVHSGHWCAQIGDQCSTGDQISQ